MKAVALAVWGLLCFVEASVVRLSHILGTSPRICLKIYIYNIDIYIYNYIPGKPWEPYGSPPRILLTICVFGQDSRSYTVILVHA